MGILNEKTDKTKVNLHLVCTTLCDRDCPNCCNKLYSFDDIPNVTKKELEECENVYLTGGEPFAYAQPNQIAKKLKADFPNIKKVIVYTNAVEFEEYLGRNGEIDAIDGFTVSIKNMADRIAFEEKISKIGSLNSYCYYFGEALKPSTFGSFIGFERKWQPVKDWKPADDSIFRKI